MIKVSRLKKLLKNIKIILKFSIFLKNKNKKIKCESNLMIHSIKLNSKYFVDYGVKFSI